MINDEITVEDLLLVYGGSGSNVPSYAANVNYSAMGGKGGNWTHVSGDSWGYESPQPNPSGSEWLCSSSACMSNRGTVVTHKSK